MHAYYKIWSRIIGSAWPVLEILLQINLVLKQITYDLLHHIIMDMLVTAPKRFASYTSL